MFWRQVVADAKALEAKRGTELLSDPNDFRGSFSGNERDVFFYNPPGERAFFQIAYSLGLDFADDGRAFVPFDMDGDGDLDLVTASLQRLRVLENRMEPRQFARVQLEATKTQHHALGAEVIVEAGGVRQQDYVKLTAGFQSQVPFDLHFGLGDASTIDRLTIRWPSGGEARFEELPAGKLLRFTEGQAAPQVSALAAWPSESRPEPRASYAIDVSATQIAGGRAPLARAGKATVLNFCLLSRICG